MTIGFQVTGGSSGIGKAVAIEVAKRGAKVTLLARNQVKCHDVFVRKAYKWKCFTKNLETYNFVHIEDFFFVQYYGFSLTLPILYNFILGSLNWRTIIIVVGENYAKFNVTNYVVFHYTLMSSYLYTLSYSIVWQKPKQM